MPVQTGHGSPFLHPTRTSWARLTHYRGIQVWVLLVLPALFVACQSDPIPRDKGYPRIDLPTARYTPLALEGLPYTFEHNRVVIARPDQDRNSEPGWIDLYYPPFDATVEITYKSLTADRTRLREYIEDARKLTSRHHIRASAIDESRLRAGTGDLAHVFRLEGEVPTQYQFYVTDSTRHFLRGALYFRTSTQNDSLAPIIQYIAGDMERLLKTLQWQKVGAGQP